MIAEIFVTIGLWICIAPALIVIAIVLIKVGIGTSISLSRPHKHDYRITDTEMNLVEMTDRYSRHEVQDTWDCDECGDTKVTTRINQYGK